MLSAEELSCSSIDAEYTLGEAASSEDIPGDARHRRHTLNCPLLSQLKRMDRPTESDIELIQRYQSGDLTASFLLLIKHYKYLLKIILNITQGHWFSEDILQAGAIGLFEAAKRFDTKKKNTFLTYATSWIKKYVYIEVRNELLPMGGIAIGRDAKERLFNYIKLLMQGKSDDEIMKTLKITAKKLTELKIMNVTAARVKSLDYINPNSEDQTTETDSYNFIESTDLSPMEETINNELREFIESQIASLSCNNPLLASLLSMKLGVNGEHECLPSEIRKRLNISKTEYAQLDREGNKYLRTKLITNGWYEKV